MRAYAAAERGLILPKLLRGTRALQNALDVTAATYRYVADVETDFAVTPPVICFDLSRAFVDSASPGRKDVDSLRSLSENLPGR